MLSLAALPVSRAGSLHCTLPASGTRLMISGCSLSKRPMPQQFAPPSSGAGNCRLPWNCAAYSPVSPITRWRVPTPEPSPGGSRYPSQAANWRPIDPAQRLANKTFAKGGRCRYRTRIFVWEMPMARVMVYRFCGNDGEKGENITPPQMALADIERATRRSDRGHRRGDRRQPP